MQWIFKRSFVILDALGVQQNALLGIAFVSVELADGFVRAVDRDQSSTCNPRQPGVGAGRYHHLPKVNNLASAPDRLPRTQWLVH